MRAAFVLHQIDFTVRYAQVHRRSSLARARMEGKFPLVGLHPRQISLAALLAKANDVPTQETDTGLLRLLATVSTLPLVVGLNKRLEVIWQLLKAKA